MIAFRKALSACVAVVSAVTMLSAQQFPDVTAISLEDLMNLQVTSVSKREQKLADAPAAIFVITQDDIRRSGSRNIPEALRLAPGVEVARIDENKWAITSRGFNGRFANKLLVLIDGRTVYTPLFSGVYWNVQDVLLEDVDRIEVIRGPGATLWGANAVNGVINIITRETKATQGGLITTTAGSELEGLVGARYGNKIDSNTYFGPIRNISLGIIRPKNRQRRIRRMACDSRWLPHRQLAELHGFLYVAGRRVPRPL